MNYIAFGVNFTWYETAFFASLLVLGAAVLVLMPKFLGKAKQEANNDENGKKNQVTLFVALAILVLAIITFL